MKPLASFSFRTSAAIAVLAPALALGIGTARADEVKPEAAPAKTAVAQSKVGSCSNCCPAAGAPESGKIIVTTGSAIPEKVKVNQTITHSSRNLRIVDRKQIERTGAGNLTDALRMLNR